MTQEYQKWSFASRFNPIYEKPMSVLKPAVERQWRVDDEGNTGAFSMETFKEYLGVEEKMRRVVESEKWYEGVPKEVKGFQVYPEESHTEEDYTIGAGEDTGYVSEEPVAEGDFPDDVGGTTASTAALQLSDTEATGAAAALDKENEQVGKEPDVEPKGSLTPIIADLTNAAADDTPTLKAPWCAVAAECDGVVSANPHADGSIKVFEYGGKGKKDKKKDDGSYTTRKTPATCIICDGRLLDVRAAYEHFDACVKLNGNPNGRYWYEPLLVDDVLTLGGHTLVTRSNDPNRKMIANQKKHDDMEAKGSKDADQTNRRKR